MKRKWGDSIAKKGIKGITVEIGGETTGLQKALKEVNDNAYKLSAEMREVDRALKLDPTNTELLAQKQQILAKQAETAKDKLQSLKSVQEQVTQQFQNGEIGEEAYRAFQREVAVAESNVKRLDGQLEETNQTMRAASDSTDDLSDSLDDAGNETKSLSQEVETSESKLKRFGEVAKEVGKMAAAAFKEIIGFAIDFGKQSVQVGADFDSSMSQVAATLGLTSEDIRDNVEGAGDTFDLLKDKAKEMGAATNFSASQAADGLNVLAMSGYSAQKSVDMIEDVLHLSAAGSMDMAQAAGYLSGAMKGFNDESKNSAYYADLMAKGATLANTSVAQLGEAMSSGAAGAAAYSQSADSMTVALLRLAEQGEVGSAAGTALAAAMKNLYTPTATAKKTLKALNVSAYDANGTARDFNVVVNELEASMAGLTEEEKNAKKQAIFGIQGLNAYNKMVVTSIEKQDQWAEALANSAGEAANQYATMTDNLQGDVDIWNSALEGFQIEISDKLMPTVRKFVRFGSDSLSKLTAAFKNNGIEGAAQALGEILSDGIMSIVDAVPKVVDVGVRIVQVLITSLVQQSPLLIQSIFQIIESCVEGIAELLPTLLPRLTEALTQILQMLVGNLPMLLQAGLQLIQGLAEGILEAIPVLIGALPQLILSIVHFILKNIPTIIQAGIDLLTALVSALPSIIQQIVAVLPQIITGIVDALLDNLPLIVQAGIDLLIALVQDLPTIITTIVGAIPLIINHVLDALMDAIPQLIDAGITLFIALVDNMPAILDGIVQAVPKIISSLMTAIMQSVPQIAQSGFKLLVSIVSKLPQIISTIVSSIPEIISGIVEAFGKLVSEMWTIGKHMIEGLWEGIKSMGSWLGDRCRDFGNAWVSGFKTIFGIHSPSTLFRDEIGKNLALGLGIGFTDSMEQVTKDMQKSLPTSFDIDPQMNLRGVNQMAADLSEEAAAASQTMVFNLNVENFTNQSESDLREIMDYAGRYFSAQMERRSVVF